MAKSQPEDKRDRIRESDTAKFAPFGHAVTANEIHAVVIGLTAGTSAGASWLAGLQEPAVVALLALAGYAIIGRPFGRSGDPEACGSDDKPIGLKTIKHEPWYFLAPLLVAFIGVVTVGGLV